MDPPDYRASRFVYASERVAGALDTALALHHGEYLINKLVRHFKAGLPSDGAIPKEFERAVIFSMRNGIRRWKKQQLVGRQMEKGSEKKTTFFATFKVNVGDYEPSIPQVNVMKVGTIYYPQLDSFPLCDMLYKAADTGELHIFQCESGLRVTSADLTYTNSMAKSFCEMTGMELADLADKVHLYVVTRPGVHVESVKFDEGVAFKSVSAISIPPNFKSFSKKAAAV